MVTIVSDAKRMVGRIDEPLDHGADQEADKRHDGERKPERAGLLRQQRQASHGPQHEEVAVGDVDDVEQPEDDRKAERDQGDDQSPDQSVDGQRDDDIGHEAFLASVEKWSSDADRP